MSMLNEEYMSLRTGPAASLADLVNSAFMDPHDDHISLLNIWEAYKFQSVRVCRNMSDDARFAHLSQWCLQRYLDYDILQSADRTFQSLLSFAKREMRKNDDEEIQPAPHQVWEGPEFSVVIWKVLLKSGFLRIAVKDSNNVGYRTLGENQSGLIHPGSFLIRRDYDYDFIMYDRYIKTKKFYFTTITNIDSQWIFEKPLARAYASSLLTNYINNSEKGGPIKQLQAAKDKFDRNN
ncbi:Pre-mRNA-splicing factor ATP-dependent RNA helicase PRP43 [Cytospora mali]|uniref:Pre-mRNA-splicing factor ATP-dependent RNA helicase PRP43 n=1 Tax=Cytospora mali TaxID=578113 RepID=A0A194UTK7_CYTMA|nr:Pre-mRNA-splicing factor ATP-dependent RNA helicase PRP43 [Valsa mali var. pyri (nom. inval.)]